MSDYILLRNKFQCPHCRARRQFAGGNCHNCGMRIFIRPIDFCAYEADGNPRRYWLWTSSEGWIYRDHVIEGLQPLGRVVNLVSPAPNTKSTAERIAEVRADTQQKIKQIIPKRNQFGYGKSRTKV